MDVPILSVRIPATTANLGPGFDSLGLALSLYMTVDVYPSSDWTVHYQEQEYQALPTNEMNLIVQTIQKVSKKMSQSSIGPFRLKITSDIPLGKGLGSSATAIAAGIEIVDTLAKLHLTSLEKVRIGSQLEGHADNVAAALLGGMVVTYYTEEVLEVIQLAAPSIGIVILVPPNPLKTEESRGLLPTHLLHSEAVLGSAASTTFIAAVATNNWSLAGKMMEKDVFHEPFRKGQFPLFDEIRSQCRAAGAYGMTISGAGPSLLVAVQSGQEAQFAQLLQQQFPFYQSIALTPATDGALVTTFDS